MSSLAQKIADFAFETKFDDLPRSVVHETKRILLDSIGCALAGVASDKGKSAIMLAQRLGGSPESSIIGVKGKVSCHSAAFANGELINALDYDAILSPPIHPSPYVIPAPLALAESVGVPGKDLILATVLGHEIAVRISMALDSTAGCNQSIYGGTVAAGKILELDREQMSHALGIAGHFCPVPTIEKWEGTVPSAMTKFGSTGWISSAEVMAALLAQTGYVGDNTVLDGKRGLWKFFGSKGWKPGVIMENIGKPWFILKARYKQYPCCGLFTTALACFMDIISKNKLMPDEIESINVYGHPRFEKPLWRTMKLPTHVDAQFSAPYVFSVAAHRVKIGMEWQDRDTMTNPQILKFMKKVNCYAHPQFVDATSNEPKGAMVEVIARGKTFKEDRMQQQGAPVKYVRTPDEELVEKFRHNACRVLSRVKTDKAVKAIMELETLKNVKQFIEQITP